MSMKTKNEKLNTNLEQIKMNDNPSHQDNEKLKIQLVYTPRRFSVRGLRKHRGIQTSRNPQVAY